MSSQRRSEPAKVGRQIFRDPGEKYMVGERKLRNFVWRLQTELATTLGHYMPQSRTTGRYIHYAPDYLACTRRELDAIASDIGRLASKPMTPEALRASSVSPLLWPCNENMPKSLRKLGAGEGIRTLDPNLGNGLQGYAPGYPGGRQTTINRVFSIYWRRRSPPSVSPDIPRLSSKCLDSALEGGIRANF